MENTYLEIKDDSFVLGIPIQKVNAEQRIVEGFATLDNVDKAGDVLDSAASKEAFTKWAGNIREMHQKKAVGRKVSWEPKQYTDPDSGETYNGVWVAARISKGAEDTWQKVLDGTLSGFSVGGAIQEKQKEMRKSAAGEQNVWRVTKYSLGELSLVDNPCNGLANVSLVKSMDGELTVSDQLDEFEKAAKGDKSVSESDQPYGDVEYADPGYQADGKKRYPVDTPEHAKAAWDYISQTDNAHLYKPGDLAKVKVKIEEACAHFGVKLNKDFIETTDLKKDADGDADGGSAGDPDNDNDGGNNVIVAYPAQHLEEAVKSVGRFRKEADTRKHKELVTATDQALGHLHALHAAAQTKEGMAKLLDNAENDISEDMEFTEQEQSILRKFMNFMAGKPAASQEATIESEESDMDEKMVKEAVESGLEALVKSSDEKFTQVAESLSKVGEALDKVASAEKIEELTKSFDATVTELKDRLAALETSGAVQKAAEDAGTKGAEESGEKIEKGFWAGMLVPEFAQNRVREGR